MWTMSGDGVDGGGRSVVCPCVYMHICVFHCDLIFFFFFFLLELYGKRCSFSCMIAKVR